MFRIKYLAVALAISTGSAMAAGDFQGFYGQLGVGYESISPKTSLSENYDGREYKSSSSGGGSDSFTGNIGLGYTANISDKFLLGIGGDYSPINSENLGGTKIFKDNSYSLFISSATPLGDSGLLYGKVGYSASQFSLYGSKSTFHGLLLGVGLKQFISGGLYGFAEGNYVSYKDKSGSYSYGNYSAIGTVGGNSFNLMAGIGYKF